MGIKAYIVPDHDSNPLEFTFAVPLFKEYDRYRSGVNTYKGANGERLWDFCNSRFDLGRFENMDFGSDEEMCEYLKHFGCLAVPFTGEYVGNNVPNGILVMSKREMEVDDWKSMSEARAALKALAKDIEYAVNGESYGYCVVEDGDPDSEDDPEPEFVESLGWEDYEDEIDSCFGYYGYDAVYDAAKEVAEDAIREKNKAKMSKVKSKSIKPNDYHRYSIRYHGQSIDDIKESDVPYMMRKGLGYKEGHQVGGLGVFRSRNKKAKKSKRGC